MILSKCLLSRLNSPLPFEVRCQFARDVCNKTVGSLNCTEAFVINWLYLQLCEETGHSKPEIWGTLEFILKLVKERNTKSTTLSLKAAFACIPQSYISSLSKHSPTPTDVEVAVKIVSCVSIVLLYQPTSRVFISKPTILLETITSILKFLSHTAQFGLELPVEFLNVVLEIMKHALVEQILPFHKIIICLINTCLKSIMKSIITLNKQIENANMKAILNTISIWLKNTLCHSGLIKSYTIFLKLSENPEIHRPHLFDTVETLMGLLEKWFKSKNAKFEEMARELITLLLQGFFEKHQHKSVDFPFSFMVSIVSSSYMCEKNLSTQSVLLLSQLLVVCAKNSACFLKTGNISRTTMVQWFCKIKKSIFSSELQSPLIFECFKSLLAISSEIVEPDLEDMWISCWLDCGVENHCEQQTSFLCAFLQTYIRLRQIPKLFSSLTVAMEQHTGNKPKSNLSVTDFPTAFLVKFSECVLSLPIGQSLELWQILLDCTSTYFIKDSLNTQDIKNLHSITELFSSFLIHTKLSDMTIPAVKMKEVNKLLEETTKALKNSVGNSLVASFEILSLCYAWGEAILTIKAYEGSNRDLVAYERSSALFDQTQLHSYWTEAEWTACLNKVQKSVDQRLHHLLVLILIQKVRYVIQHDPNFEDGKMVVRSIATYIFQIASNWVESSSTSGESLSKIQFSNSLWESIVTWLPILVPALRLKNMQLLCQIMIETLSEESHSNSKNQVTRSFLKSSFFAESRLLQTTLLNRIWSESEKFVIDLKRKQIKDDDSSTRQTTIFKDLSKHPKIWKTIFTAPEDLDIKNSENNLRWCKIRNRVNTFPVHFQNNGRTINIDHAYELVQYLWFFPLENMEPGNQVCSLVGLLHTLSLLKNSKHEKKTQFHMLLCQAIVSLLNKTQAPRMAIIFEPSILLEEMVDLYRSCSNSKEQEWSLILLDKIVYCLVEDESALAKVEEFIHKFSNVHENLAIELQILLVITKRLVSLLKKYVITNHIESFMLCNQVTKSLVSTLSKKLRSTVDITDEKLIWQCFLCILMYYCQNVPRNMKNLKRKPEHVLKKHEPFLEKLAGFKLAFDTDVNQVYFQVITTICINRTVFENSVPCKFFLNLWTTCLRGAMSEPIEKHKDVYQEQIKSSALSALLKCLNTSELEVVFDELSVECSKVLATYNALQVKNIVAFWTMVINTDLGAETPSKVLFGVVNFIKQMLPLLFQPLIDKEIVSNAVLPILHFLVAILQKKELSLRHTQILLCLQACSGVKLSSSNTATLLPICEVLLKIYQRMLTRSTNVILQAVPPFLSCLSAILRHLISVGNQTPFLTSNDSIKKSIVICAQDFSKVLSLVANHRDDFSKQACFIIAEYVSEVQQVTLHTSVKEPLLLGIYKLMDMCDEHAKTMLQLSVNPGGREILKQLHNDFSLYYRYKGKV